MCEDIKMARPGAPGRRGSGHSPVSTMSGYSTGIPYSPFGSSLAPEITPSAVSRA